MTLPNAERAIIDPLKLHGYLLSQSHPLGRFKAKFFRKLGYSSERWHALEKDLRNQHLPEPARLVTSTQHGAKYEIRAMLKGPNGTTAQVVSVWMIRLGDNTPRFVTAYPGARV